MCPRFPASWPIACCMARYAVSATVPRASRWFFRVVLRDREGKESRETQSRGWALSKWKHAGLGLTRVMVPVLALTLLFAVGAQASEGHDAPRWGDFGWRVLNLIIFAGILWYFVGGLARKYFSGRRASISQELQDLEARRADAQKRLDEVEKRISNLESERKAILDESLAQAETVKRALVEEAQRQAEQIVQQARRTAENEGRAMLAEVRSAIADEIVDAAEKVLAEKLTAAEHEKLITNSLNKVVLH